MTELLSNATDKKISYVNISDEEARAAMKEMGMDDGLSKQFQNSPIISKKDMQVIALPRYLPRYCTTILLIPYQLLYYN